MGLKSGTTCEPTEHHCREGLSCRQCQENMNYCESMKTTVHTVGASCNVTCALVFLRQWACQAVRGVFAQRCEGICILTRVALIVSQCSIRKSCSSVNEAIMLYFSLDRSPRSVMLWGKSWEKNLFDDPHNNECSGKVIKILKTFLSGFPGPTHFSMASSRFVIKEFVW